MTTHPSTSVLIIEDEPRARQRLADAIEAQDGLTLLGTREDYASGLEALLSLKPRILLQDLGLPDGDGADIIRAIAKEGLDTEAMVITVFGDEKHVVDALAA
ncbi:MAG: response regulator, partial [Gammaproteobacteria bacterium]